MELRVLNYFLTVAREGGLTGASEVLHVTQPTMSRQIQELEEELGQKLFIRTTRSMVLTPEGMLLRKRAEEILEMAERTKAEFSSMGSAVAGDVFIGSGETFALKKVTDLMAQIREDHPGIRFQIYSGNAEDVMERLEKGLLDFGVLVEPVDVSRYNSLRLPAKDTWGLILRRDHPLAQKNHSQRKDLIGIPLIMSRQDMAAQKTGNDYLDWFGKTYESGQVRHRLCGRPGSGRQHHGDLRPLLPSLRSASGSRNRGDLEKIPGVFQASRNAAGENDESI